MGAYGLFILLVSLHTLASLAKCPGAHVLFMLLLQLFIVLWFLAGLLLAAGMVVLDDTCTSTEYMIQQEVGQSWQAS